MHRLPLAGRFVARAAAVGLGLLLLSSCTHSPPLPAGASPQLAAACKANHPAHDWKLADAPEPVTRRLFTVPRDAPAQLWFRGRDKAIAVCTPCPADANAVRTFEWLAADFKDGELKRKTCSAPRR